MLSVQWQERVNSTYFSDIKQQLKNQPGGEDGDPDSRMETERVITERRDKKAAKGKGLRGSGKSGGGFLSLNVFLTECSYLVLGASSFWKQ